MSAEKGSKNDSMAGFGEEVSLGDEFVRLNERHYQYCMEADSLEKALANSCRRQPSREARLNDLRKRLLPRLQARIDALQNQHGGLIN